MLMRCPACGQSEMTGLGRCLTCGHVQPVSETPPAPPLPVPKRGPGRPRKHPPGFDRAKAWRDARQVRLIGFYLGAEAVLALTALADEWGCSRSAAVERLLMSRRQA